jgi:response regulator RpfG family c-di-GMP phosphodiesterase
MPFSILSSNVSDEIKNKKWKILIVDDEEDIHAITKLALKRFEFDSKGVSFLSAYNSQQAKDILNSQNDIALIFLDVVMETDDAGLLLTKWIREKLKNKMIRIILRTGQPGQAPEEKVIESYDINDYKQKTELDRTKLFTTVFSALRAYRDLQLIEESRLSELKFRTGLEQVISSTSQILETKTLKQFFDGLLKQVISLIRLEDEGIFVLVDGAGTICSENRYKIIARSHCNNGSNIDKETLVLLDKARLQKQSLHEKDTYVAYFPSTGNKESLLYLKGIKKLNSFNVHLLNVFASSIGIAFDNLMLNREMIETQEELIARLGNAVESRAKDAGNHIKRIAEFSYILAEEIGLDEISCLTVKQASPMHDVGKIATPDAILLKPGQLNKDEFEVMKKHPSIGYDILKGSKRHILQAAAVISLQHHEKFDGSGYPNGLTGDNIHIYARIVAVADVFDALLHKRCYKEPWPVEKALELMEKEKGKHFDPNIVDALLKKQEKLLSINAEYTSTDMT